MSLRGRYWIDSIKSRVSGYLRLPVPPYGNPAYWEGVYRQLGPDDVFEWGNLTLQDDLLKYKFHCLLDMKAAPTTGLDFSGLSSRKGSIKNADNLHATRMTTWGETIGIELPAHHNHHHRSLATADQRSTDSILMLGCGNSKLGEDMVDAGWTANDGTILQVDVSSRVIEAMSHRCVDKIVSGDIQLVQDDATVLSAFTDNKIRAVIDKGLVDALFCTDDYEQCYHILQSVHRVLQPGGIFCVLSYSQPAFLLERLLLPPDLTRMHVARTMWQHVQVRQLDSILLYRFQKTKFAKSLRLSSSGRR